ncbi:hypothetical protein MHYP_G00128340 [Metynnis hypsauchen]
MSWIDGAELNRCTNTSSLKLDTFTSSEKCVSARLCIDYKTTTQDSPTTTDESPACSSLQVVLDQESACKGSVYCSTGLSAAEQQHSVPFKLYGTLREGRAAGKAGADSLEWLS